MTDTTPLKVLVYSDDANTRQQVILALGRRPHPDLPELTYVEVATEPVVIQQMDAKNLTGLDQRARHFDIGHAGRRVSTRMVVHDHDAAGCILQRGTQHIRRP